MPALMVVARSIDRISKVFGILANWMVLFAALACALDALMRYSISGILLANKKLGGNELLWLFDFYKDNSNTLRDIQLLFFAGMVMLGSAWTLKVNEHVRVDLFYTQGSDRKRLWIDLTGCLFFLIPFCLLMIYFSWPWFMESYLGGEGSQNAGGLPRWPAKFFIPFGFALLLLQGASELIKCVLALATGQRREHAYEKPLQ